MTFIDIEREEVAMRICPFCGETMFDNIEAQLKYGGMREMKEHIINDHPDSIEGDIKDLKLFDERI